MSKILYKLNKQEKKEWNKWIKSKPKIIQKLAKRFPPNKLFFLKPSKQWVIVFSYSENNTLTAFISKKYNPSILLERQVFGISPEDLK